MAQAKLEMITPNSEDGQTIMLCSNEISGAQPFIHWIVPGCSQTWLPDQHAYHILVLVQGEAIFRCAGEDRQWSERVTFIPGLDQSLTVQAIQATQILEIQWNLIPDDYAEIAAFQTAFPYVMPYSASKQYKDRNKSDKTISRIMVEQRTIPGFCMGSVESYGYDYVKPHDHPMLDQFFYSFPESNMVLLIDDNRQDMAGNVLTHIPLGAKHGVEVTPGNHMHYIWIDFFRDEAGIKRLDTSHIPTGIYRQLSPGQEQ